MDEGFTGEDYYTKVTVLSAGGTLGDVMWTSVGGGGIYNLVAQKMLAPSIRSWRATSSTWPCTTRAASTD